MSDWRDRDPEWKKAEETGERTTYWIYTDNYHTEIRYLRCYTPALAEVVHKRTGWKIVPFCNPNLPSYDFLR